LDPDLDEGYLIKFVAEFSYSLHLNLPLKWGSEILHIFMFDFSVIPIVFKWEPKTALLNFIA